MARKLLLLRLGFENIRLNWRHSLATLLAITAGFAAVSLFDGFMQEIRLFTVDSTVSRGMLGDVVIEKFGARDKYFEDPWGYSMDSGEQAFVKKFLDEDSRDQVSVRFLGIAGLISNSKTSAVFMGVGYDLQEGKTMRGKRWEWNTSAGIPMHLTADQPMALGSGLASRLDCQMKEHDFYNPDGTFVPKERPFACDESLFQVSVTTEHAQVNAMNLKPTALMDMQLREINDRLLLLPLARAQELFDTDRVTRITVLLNDHGKAGQFIRDFNEKARASNIKIEAFAWIDHPLASIAKGGLEILNVFHILFMFVVAVIAAMSVANTMMKSINERIREIGTLRSIGFRQSDIITLFTAEGFFLGSFACGVGFVVTLILAYLISHSGLTFRAGVLSSSIPLRISPSIGASVVSLIILSLITAGTSWLVARRTAKMVVADALRYVA